MGIEFEIRKPDGELEYDFSMSYGGLSNVIDVGRKAGVDTSEYSRILDYDYDDEEIVIESEDIQKLLIFCRNMLDVLLQLEKEGTVLLSRNEEINYEKMMEAGLASSSSRNKYAGTIPRLRALIILCEKALAAKSPIIMIP